MVSADRPPQAHRPAGANRPRAVVLVANLANPYSRGLRVARSLAAAGFDVEIAATTGVAAPVEERDGDVAIRRYRPKGRWAVDATEMTGGSVRLPRRRFGPLGGLLQRAVKAVAWPVHVRGWWAALRAELLR